MNKFFYTKLAFNNIKNNKKTYIPYMLTCIGTIIMYYLIDALSVDKALDSMYGGQFVQSYLMIGKVVIALFAIIFLFYTNNFLIRNRKKELAMFNILGMEKKHIGLIMLLETIIIAIVTLIAGIVLGILFSKLALLLLFKILNFDVQFGFSIHFSSIMYTVILFIFIFTLSMLNNIRQVHFTNPIQLLSSEKQGEKEPKARIILALLGFASLGTGYYLAVKTKDPIAAIGVFFLAVILVIIGTYLIFMTGSILILKILRKNKGYYYKTKHFINVSGMIYRMKQNSAGLSNICILSTMVLVTLSTTVALYTGMDDIVTSRYPNSICIETSLDNGNGELIEDDYFVNLTDKVDKELDKYGAIVTKKIGYKYLGKTLMGKDDTFVPNNDASVFDESINDFYIITGDDYNRLYNEDAMLSENEAYIMGNKTNYSYDKIKIGSNEFSITGKTVQEFPNMNSSTNMINSYYMVVKDQTVLNKIFEDLNNLSTETRYGANYLHYIGIDMDAADEDQIAALSDIKEIVKSDDVFSYADGRSNSKHELYGIYGGLLFLGIFCGILFIMATVLIMYYKQISEGFDDKRRFSIMQQVGMSKREIKNSIHSQVLMVFFLPLIVAGIHTAFAFPLISRILDLMHLTNIGLFVISTICTFVIFGVFYIIVYTMTAKTYYKIVK